MVNKNFKAFLHYFKETLLTSFLMSLVFIGIPFVIGLLLYHFPVLGIVILLIFSTLMAITYIKYREDEDNLRQ